MNVELLITEDGSNTLFVPNINEHYHSIYGAISESKHVFINAGLKHILKDKTNIAVLEIGFGTGLNALLTLLELSEKRITCEYTAIEAFPLNEETYNKLNYSKELNINEDLFFKLHNAEWDIKVNILPNFIIKKILCVAQDMSIPENYFDLVYFDAFSPDVHPEMWTKEVFSKIFISLKNNAVLTTYSTKGNVKRILKEIGFKVEKLPGPKGKREILRVLKSQ